MIYPIEFLDRLQGRPVSALAAVVYRHMFGTRAPTVTNTLGARWNPAGVAAIYTSCERETALAEAEHYIALQPFRPRVVRHLFSITVSLQKVIDISSLAALDDLGVSSQSLEGLDFTDCQRLGGAVRFLGNDGMLVPSARRAGGRNLVIYEQDLRECVFEIVSDEIVG